MIYRPSDDTYLIAEQVKKFSKGKKVLDIGTGSSYLAKIAKESGAIKVIVSDINPEVISNAHSLGFFAIKSDLFSEIKQKFDLIIFNPPYLPEDENEDKESKIATTGGKRGDEIILRFLKDAPSRLYAGGVILLLLSSLTPKNKINEIIYNKNLKMEKLSEKAFFFETLSVYKININ